MMRPSQSNPTPEGGDPGSGLTGPGASGPDAARQTNRERLVEVLDEYLASMEQGRWPTLEELAAAHPELADELPDYLEGLHLIHSALTEPVPGELLGGIASGDSKEVFRPEESAPAHQGGDGLRKRIGDFELINVIGRGGMGVVYEAWQISLNRRVALKVLPFAAMLDERQTARFNTEAQAAAGLHHQNIVPVHAVGQERGVHFYAMQFIDGHSLAEAIEEMRDAKQFAAQPDRRDSPDDTTVDTHSGRAPSTLGTFRGAEFFRAVARLGAEAADALEHAHQFGVVHRDVKPANLMVDRAGKLWVTDFGLARVQSEMSMTMPGDLVGSLRYMSPEQARGRGDLIDCRTDVYGLGATLYELLTLQPAHSSKDHEELLRRVFYDEPVPPRKLNSAIPPDLENVVRRAMAKSREERYATAQCLADDLRRYLEGKPTVARRPSLSDRTAKWVARRRGVAFSAAAALVIVTVVSLFSALWIAAAGRQTAAALKASRTSQALAESHFEQARSVVDHFGGDLADRLAAIPGAESLRRELLSDTLGYYQRFLQTVGDDLSLENDLAATLFKSGAIAERLGEPLSARNFYARAVEGWRRLDSAPPGHPAGATPQSSAPDDHTLELGLGLGALARVQGELGEIEESEELFDEAVGLLRARATALPSDPAPANALAETLSNYGLMLRRDGRSGLAAPHLREAIRWLTAATRLRPEEPLYVRNLAVANSNLSEALREHSPAEAIAACRDARLAMRRLVQDYPEDNSYLADLAMTYNNLAALQGAEGDWASAAEGYQQAADQLKRLVRQNPLIPGRRRELAITQSNLGLALARLGKTSESDEAFDGSQQMLAGLVEDFPDQIAYRSALAALWNNRGVALQACDRDEEALRAFAKAVEQQEQLAQQGGITLAQASVLNKQYQNYAELLRQADRDEEQQAVEERRRQLLIALPADDNAPSEESP